MSESDFKDLFSGFSADYARFRPTYPAALFEFLASAVTDHTAAWDCATGNGQAAVALAPFFDSVLATDASDAQLASASLHPHVHYSRGTAEASGLESASVTLVCVAQAFHWFRQPAFFAEVRRVARAGESVLAIWMYNLCRVSPAVDLVVDDFYTTGVGRYWEPERRLLDEEYRFIEVPFTPLATPTWTMELSWTPAQLLGYIGTWSALRIARSKLGSDPLLDLAPRLAAAWGDVEEPRPVRWPLTCRFFRL